MTAEPHRRVALVSMPFLFPSQPALGLELLAAVLRRRQHSVTVHYLGLEAAAILGLADYVRIRLDDCQGAYQPLFTGEWLFAHDEITPGAASLPAYRAFLRSKATADGQTPFADLDLARTKATLDHLLVGWGENTAWGDYDVVGFNVLFQQLNASLRLAYRIKTRFASTRVVLGGWTVAGPMGQAILNRYEWLDAVFDGYAELSLPDYIERLPPRSPIPIRQVEPPMALDELPTPQYDTFFNQFAAAGLEGESKTWVPIETSRGCWWGAKHQCLFCAFNARQISYRQKSKKRARIEIETLRHYNRPLWFADNILPSDFLRDVLAPSERPTHGYGFAFVKSNIKLAELRAAAEIGQIVLEPGIESLSTPILKLLQKGNTAVQHVWLLRAAEELGITLFWIHLYGAPGEDPAEYAKLAAWLPRISHLQAPSSAVPIRVERFSAIHANWARLGLVDVRPADAYRLAFGPHPDLADQAFYFDSAHATHQQPDEYSEPWRRMLRDWTRLALSPLRPWCEIIKVGGRHLLIDNRHLGRMGRGHPRVKALTRDEWRLLQLLDQPVRTKTVEQRWTGETALGPLIGRLDHQGWLLQMDGRLVRLAVIRPANGLALAARRRLSIFRARRAMVSIYTAQGLRRLHNEIKRFRSRTRRQSWPFPGGKISKTR